MTGNCERLAVKSNPTILEKKGIITQNTKISVNPVAVVDKNPCFSKFRLFSRCFSVTTPIISKTNAAAKTVATATPKTSNGIKAL